MFYCVHEALLTTAVQCHGGKRGPGTCLWLVLVSLGWGGVLKKVELHIIGGKKKKKKDHRLDAAAATGRKQVLK
jgi:hypothetical protein